MKRMIMMCMAILFLAMPGFSSKVYSCLDDYLEMSAQAADGLRKELKDTEKLRSFVEGLIGAAYRPDLPEVAEEIKRKLGISDKSMQTALMVILREEGARIKWKKSQWPNDRLDSIADWRLSRGLIWMGFCADAEGKKFLMKTASDSAVDREFRARAIGSYLSRADKKERLDAVTRFLAGDMKGSVDPFWASGLYNSAIRVYDEAEGDTKTRDAIVAILSAVLMEEKNELYFEMMDKNLAERSKEYAESPQRKAALERMNPPVRRNAP